MALNTISLRSSLSAYLQLFTNRREVSTDVLNQHGEIIRKVDGVLEGVATKESGILTSKVLSDQGKSQALAELGTATAPKLAFLERVVSKLDDDQRAMEATLFTVKPPATLGSDPLLQYLYGKEIRDRFHGLTQQDKDLAFLQASEVEVDPDDRQAQANRDAVLWAFQVTPGGPDITPDVLTRALDERARRTNPETAARLQDVTLLHDSLSGLRDSVVNWLKGLGGDQKKIFDELGGPLPEPTALQTTQRMVAA